MIVESMKDNPFNHDHSNIFFKGTVFMITTVGKAYHLALC